ncbi:glycosyltransferase [Agromyces sp. NPDC056523]|uniref:glycosyltransferase n=1 Tax=Agromyces sp. NPDC056523 TaxID=3345850 RepID=UPI00367344DB
MFASLASGVWGAERSMFTLARELRESGHRIHLICTDQTLADEWLRATGESASVVSASRPSRGRLSLVRSYWSHLANQTSKRDVVVLFSYALAAGAILPLRWRAGRPRVVLDLHDTLTAGFGRRALAVSAFRLDRVIAVSEFTLRQLRVRRSIGRVLTRPVAKLDAQPVEPSSIPLRVGIVGRVNSDKAPHLVIQACVELDACVTIRGDIDNDSETYAADVRALGERVLGERFRMEGPTPWSRALDDIDALVVANAREPMGRTVLEAQLRGIMAVVPDSGGAAELVEHLVTGVKYRAGDASSLAKALKMLTRDLRIRVTETARARAIAVTDPKEYAARYAHAVFD